MTFMSLDTDIATVDEDGIITGKEIGKAEIVVTHKITNKTATIFVNVVPEGKTICTKSRSRKHTHSSIKSRRNSMDMGKQYIWTTRNSR